MGEESSKIDDGVADWEAGLPSVADLTPLSQSLIPAELATAFKITAEPPRTMVEVNRASETTLSSLNSAPNLKPYEDVIIYSDEQLLGSDPKRNRTVTEEETIDNSQGKAVKRPRLVWTPQLHKRFVDVVGHLGLKNAVPKTIMQLMNVEGLTRENVASHLQKYRLYVKRMQGLSNEEPSPSDNLFASTPLPPAQSFNESSSGQGNVNSNRSHGNTNNGASVGHIGMQMPVMPMSGNASGGFTGYETGSSLHHHHHYHHHYQQQFNSMAQQQQRDWSANNNKYNSSNA